MNLQAIINDIKTFPPDIQQEVADFVSFLKMRLGMQAQKNKKKNATAGDDGFTGMWADRNEMIDSTAWVNTLRTGEWK